MGSTNEGALRVVPFPFGFSSNTPRKQGSSSKASHWASVHPVRLHIRCKGTPCKGFGRNWMHPETKSTAPLAASAKPETPQWSKCVSPVYLRMRPSSALCAKLFASILQMENAQKWLGFPIFPHSPFIRGLYLLSHCKTSLAE